MDKLERVFKDDCNNICGKSNFGLKSDSLCGDPDKRKERLLVVYADEDKNPIINGVDHGDGFAILNRQCVSECPEGYILHQNSTVCMKRPVDQEVIPNTNYSMWIGAGAILFAIVLFGVIYLYKRVSKKKRPQLSALHA